jgi:hypothetical protein
MQLAPQPLLSIYALTTRIAGKSLIAGAVSVAAVARIQQVFAEPTFSAQAIERREI